jgi:hypothetical protein
MSASSRPATASEIIEIVGHLDDAVIARIQGDGSDAGLSTRRFHLGHSR